ncbi:aminoglycoside phosphotransferase family protein [Novosphingobium sp.]|uniref:aminoglycoside phosphotransferase family protein n=1 Tax=Novosphingobium sp. TaxID=1874826 RepID=UPI00260BFC7B|nr:aminoglycoside phosphotransferase family protein [Novosphingobium sp.]
MLSSPNRDLAARDRALPALPLLLDPPALAAFVRARWPDYSIGELALDYLRYKPAQSCLAAFHAVIDGQDTRLVFKAYRTDAHDKLGKVALKAGEDGPLGAGRQLLGEQAMVLQCFPNDTALKGLRRLFAPGGLQKYCKALSLDPAGEAQMHTLSYRPERRHVARIDVAGKPFAALKLFDPAAFDRAAANAPAFRSKGTLVVPRLLGCSPRYHCIASEWVQGRAIAQDVASAARLGEALALLHGQSSAHLDRLTCEDQIASARSIAKYIGTIWPALGPQAEQIAGRISQQIDQTGPVTALHGDLHLEQVLDLGDAVGLIDFDEAVLGPAEWDIANLLAHMSVAGTEAADLDAFAKSLLAGYHASGRTHCSAQLRVQTAFALLRLAATPFRRQVQDWPGEIARILDRALALLDPPTLDPAMPSLEAALSPQAAAAAFARAGLDCTVAQARSVRHKPARRCLIAYDLVDNNGRTIRALGKMRAKGADRRSFDLHQDLRGHDIAVPRPVLFVPELGMWLQEVVPGRSFDPAAMPPDMVAKAISRFHKAPLRPHRQHRLGDELSILGTRLSALAARHPDLAARIERLSREAHRRVAGSGSGPLHLIHRDFYQDHLILSGDELYLIDLDQCCLGDPAIDIGNFTAHLIELGLRQHGDAGRFRHWQQAFVANCCELNPALDRARVSMCEWLTLIRLVEIADRMPERRSTMMPLLELCEAGLASMLECEEIGHV